MAAAFEQFLVHVDPGQLGLRGIEDVDYHHPFVAGQLDSFEELL